MSLEIANLVTYFTGDTRDVDSAFDHVERRAMAHVNKVNQTLSSLKSLSGFAAGAAGGVAAMLGLGAIGSLADASSAIVQYSANLEQTKIAFTTLMKSSSEAEAHLRELQKFAAETPFEFTELTQASRRFQNMGLSAKQVIPLLTAVGDAVAAAGGSSEQINQVSLAISQMVAKNKVSAEEINQLAEAGIGGWEILSQALGKSKAEVIKLSEQGRISADVFIKAFKEFSSLNFGGAMEAQSKTFTGALSTIKDALMMSASKSFEPLFEKISEIAVRLSKALKDADSLDEAAQATGYNIGQTLGEGAAYIFTTEFLWNVKSGLDTIGDTIISFFAGLFENDVIVYGIKELMAELRGLMFDDGEEGPNIVLFDQRALNGQLAQLKDFQGEVDKLNFSKKPKMGLFDETSVLDKTKNILSDLTDKYENFGEKTNVAATKQKLLKAGVEDLNDGLAKQAIVIAKEMDKLNEWKNLLTTLDSLLKRTSEFTGDSAESSLMEAFISKGVDVNSAFAQQQLAFAKWLDTFKQSAQVVDELTSLRGEATKFVISAVDESLDASSLSKFEIFEQKLEHWKTLAETFRIKMPDGSERQATLNDLFSTEQIDKYRAMLKTADDKLKESDEQTKRLAKDKALYGYFDSGLQALTAFNKEIQEQMLGNNSVLGKLQDKFRDTFKDFFKVATPEQAKKAEETFSHIFSLFQAGEKNTANQYLYNLAERIGDVFKVFSYAEGKGVKDVEALAAALKNFFEQGISKSGLDGLREFQQLMEQFNQNLFQDAEEIGNAHLELMRTQGASEKQIRSEQLKFAEDLEKRKHELALAELRRVKTEITQKGLSLKQEEDLMKLVNQRIESEEKRHQIAMQQISEEANTNTFKGKLEAFRNSIPDIGDALEDSFFNSLDAISSSLGQHLTDWRQGFSGMLKGIGLDFADLMRQMATELMKLLMMQLLMKAIGGIFGGLLGGAGGASTGGLGHELGHIGGFASGGDVEAGDWAWVGERGKELVQFGSDATVYSHEDSMNILNNLGKRNIDGVMSAGGGDSIGVMNQSNSNSSSNVTYHNDNSVHINVTAPPQQGGSKMPPPSDRQYLNRLASMIAEKLPKH